MRQKQLAAQKDGKARVDHESMQRIKLHLRKFNARKNTHYNTAKAFGIWREKTENWKKEQ